MLSTPELEIARNLPREKCGAEEAQRYTRWLATHHYENFNVVSWLLPRRLHQDFYNVYAYCRWSDDLGDEVPDPARASRLLDAWEEELRKIYASEDGPSHPVLIALGETIRAKEIPLQPFSDLLRAFRQDQTVHRYATWDGVYDYCVYSANPVGRLVLYVCGYRDEGRQRLSDYTCTALQLANFWQDVSRDLEKGRIYIPIEELTAHGITVGEIVERKFDDRYLALMKSLIARTRELFYAGLPLAGRVDEALRVDIELFSRGGLAILEAIEKAGYNTLERRPALSKATKLRLVGRALGGKIFGSSSSSLGEISGGAEKVKTGASGVKTPDVRGALMSELKLRPPENRASAQELADAEASKTADVRGVLMSELKLRPPENRASTQELADAEGRTSIDSAELVRASYAECNRIARAAKSSFYLAFFGLPRPKRNALCALYAFMRLVDDVSDEPGGLDAKRAGLARWRAMLDEAVAGRTGAHPILPALADTIARFRMPTRYFHDLILGAEMDLTVKSYATFDRLSEYCYRVAGTVGLTCLHVFGFREPHAPDLAERLGLAFQLTNIIRDVRSDFDMGRVYLPEEDLARFGCRAEELRGPLTPALGELLAFEAGRAWRLYEEGAPLVNMVNAESRATLWALVRTYSTLLARIEEDGFDVFSARVSLSSMEKIQYLVVAGMSGRWKRDALAKRSGDRRRPGGDVLRRRAG